MTSSDSGGKNASLAKHDSATWPTPVSPSRAVLPPRLTPYREFLGTKGSEPNRIHAAARRAGMWKMQCAGQSGKQIREWVMDAPFPRANGSAIRSALPELIQPLTRIWLGSTFFCYCRRPEPDASFAGPKQEPFLNTRGWTM